MAQFARPSSDITVTSFTGFPVNTAGNRYQNIDETSASSSDYVSGATNTAAVYETGLSSINDPNVHSGHIIRWQAAKTAGTGSIVLTIGLYQGTTLIGSTTQSLSITGLFTSANFTLTETEAANITNYAGLRIRFTQQQASGRAIAVSWAELEVPDVVVLTTGEGFFAQGGQVF